MKNKRILVADDIPDLLSSLQAALSRDYDVDTATSGMEVIRKISENSFDGLIIDVDFKAGMTGLEAAEAVREIDPDVKIIIFSAYTYSDEDVRRAVELGATFKTKPLHIEDVHKYIGKRR